MATLDNPNPNEFNTFKAQFSASEQAYIDTMSFERQVGLYNLGYNNASYYINNMNTEQRVVIDQFHIEAVNNQQLSNQNQNAVSLVSGASVFLGPIGSGVSDVALTFYDRADHAKDIMLQSQDNFINNLRDGDSTEIARKRAIISWY